jgi:hypothetical protein
VTAALGGFYPKKLIESDCHLISGKVQFFEGVNMKRTIQVAGILMAMALLVSACLPEASTQQNQQQAQNTPTLALDTQSQVNTAVAQTVEANSQISTAVALTTEAQATATPTATEFTIPTLTPFVVLTPTTRPSGGSYSHAKSLYACDIIHIRPYTNATYNRGQKFDVKMTVVNQGTMSWYQGFDLKYSGGDAMTSTKHIELPAMDPDDQYSVTLDAEAPSTYGQHTMTWMVEGKLCFGYITIVVK